MQGDYGLDMTVEIVSGERVTGREFSIQLKATDHLRTAGDQVAHHCAVSAARYFLDRPEPVMYVVYDAQAEVAYWLWVQPYLRDLDAARPGWRDRKTVAIRLPIANRLTADSAPAIAEHVRAWWARMLAAIAPPTPYLPPRPLPDFVGREDELRSLDAGLAPGSRTAITGVIGMGGIGKTELAQAGRLARRRALSRRGTVGRLRQPDRRHHCRPVGRRLRAAAPRRRSGRQGRGLAEPDRRQGGAAHL